MERVTLSQNWSRVNRLTPALIPRMQIQRQVYRGQPWYVFHDPVGNSFFRVNPVSYHLLGLLDGKRTVDEVWRLTLDRHGDAAPTQNEVIGLLGQLYTANLLRVDLPVDAQPLLKRQRQRALKHWGGQAMSLLFMRFPLFNPDPILTWLLPFFRPLLSKAGLLLWVVWLCLGVYVFLPHMGSFVHDVYSVLAPSNWLWMIVLFLLTKTIHEMGHGLLCKRFGGDVPQIGIMMLVLLPAPYVDATSSWSMPGKWRRTLVAAGGMMFELTIAVGAAILWTRAEPTSTLRQVCFNLVFLTSITTILFNANPLLRFDGYYMLSDLLEIPNLYERATQHLQWLAQRFAFGVRSVPPVSTVSGERLLLTLYGLLSFAYRFVILFGIILFIAGQLFEIGLLLAAWSCIAWGLAPLGKFSRYLVASPSLAGHRGRAVAVTATALALGIALIGIWPMEDHRRAAGIVESAQRSDIAVLTPGFVTRVAVESGQLVQRGQILLETENRDLLARRADLQAERKRLNAQRLDALTHDAVALKMSLTQIAWTDEQLRDVDRRLDELIVRSPQDGILIGGSMQELQGQYLTRGRVIAQVIDPARLRVTAFVGQAHNAPLFNDQKIARVELRTAGEPGRSLPSQVLQQFDSGRTSLPHPALGYRGGGPIATDPSDHDGLRMLRPHFELWLALPRELVGASVLPGQRVTVRFTLQRRSPLAAQWFHRLRQLLRERITN